MHIAHNVACPLLLLNVIERLDVDNAWIANVLDTVQLQNDVTLLLLELNSELGQNSLQVLHFDQTFVVSHRIVLQLRHYFGPTLRVSEPCHLFVNVSVKPCDLLLVLPQVRHAEERSATDRSPATFLAAR